MFDIIIADPSWEFNDKLTMDDVKRGASSIYSTLNVEHIKGLKIKELSNPDSILALWVPSALLKDGLDTMTAWGFTQKQTLIWVKTKKQPLKLLLKDFKKILYKNKDINLNLLNDFKTLLELFNVNSILAFGLGHYFRQTHEVCLIGVRGKIATKVKNKSRRSVFFHSVADKHSEKPNTLHEELDLMFGNSKMKKLELFARRQYPGYLCVGNEAPMSINEDIRDSVDKLLQINDNDYNKLISTTDESKLFKMWSNIGKLNGRTSKNAAA